MDSEIEQLRNGSVVNNCEKIFKETGKLGDGYVCFKGVERDGDVFFRVELGTGPNVYIPGDILQLADNVYVENCALPVTIGIYIASTIEGQSRALMLHTSATALSRCADGYTDAYITGFKSNEDYIEWQLLSTVPPVDSQALVELEQAIEEANLDNLTRLTIRGITSNRIFSLTEDQEVTLNIKATVHRSGEASSEEEIAVLLRRDKFIKITNVPDQINLLPEIQYTLAPEISAPVCEGEKYPQSFKCEIERAGSISPLEKCIISSNYLKESSNKEIPNSFKVIIQAYLGPQSNPNYYARHEAYVTVQGYKETIRALHGSTITIQSSKVNTIKTEILTIQDNGQYNCVWGVRCIDRTCDNSYIQNRLQREGPRGTQGVTIPANTLESNRDYLFTAICTDDNDPGYQFKTEIEVHTHLVEGKEKALTPLLHLNTQGIGFSEDQDTQIVCAIDGREQDSFVFKWVIQDDINSRPVEDVKIENESNYSIATIPKGILKEDQDYLIICETQVLSGNKIIEKGYVRKLISGQS